MTSSRTDRTDAVIISSEMFRGHHYGPNHPLSIPRVPLTIDLINAYRPLTSVEHIPARIATIDELTLFHTREYVDALVSSQKNRRIAHGFRQAFNLGNFENPFFEKLFTIPALAAGGSIQGAQYVLSGVMAFNPAGGMHHAFADKARGFCYLNDAVLGILKLKNAGLRVLYFDLDAHHGDGVQQAFDKDEHVLTVSFHMDTDYAYPRRGGTMADISTSKMAVNLPLPKKINDSEYQLAFETIWPELIDHFRPDAVVLQAGTDILEQDPLGKFNISNHLFLNLVKQIKQSSPFNRNGIPRLLVLGGGGYHPIALARCWTGVWGVLAGWNLGNEIPSKGTTLLKTIHETLSDNDETGMPAEALVHLVDQPLTGPVRDDIPRRVDSLLKTHPLFTG